MHAVITNPPLFATDEIFPALIQATLTG